MWNFKNLYFKSFTTALACVSNNSFNQFTYTLDKRNNLF